MGHADLLAVVARVTPARAMRPLIDPASRLVGSCLRFADHRL